MEADWIAGVVRRDRRGQRVAAETECMTRRRGDSAGGRRNGDGGGGRVSVECSYRAGDGRAVEAAA